jgi:hypothetical protein
MFLEKSYNERTLTACVRVISNNKELQSLENVSKINYIL